MSDGTREKFDNPVIEWVDSRLPLFTLMKKEYGVFPTPKNFNYFWNFGAIAGVMLVIMIITGVSLAMHYTPNTQMAFDSVERITRDVNHGWLIRYMHMNGASFFFIAVYFHIFRGMYYGSYKKPRELLWIMGVVIFLLMMATAFMGYVLPWGQMSFWGATVITNLFSAIPVIGDDIVTLLWGGFSVDNPTLNRFFALHYLLPFLIFAVVFVHIWGLHVTGSNNPLGIEPKDKEKDTIPFNPYYTVKDTFGLLIFMMVYVAFTFFRPDSLGHPDNYIPANPMVTPPHIVPEWYFLPFYAILRAITFDIFFIPAKLGGVIAMFGAIILLIALPFIDRHPVRSACFRPYYRIALILLVIMTFALGFAGARPPEGAWVIIGQVATAYYFSFFLIVLPLLNRFEPVKVLPESIDAAIQAKKSRAPIGAVVLAIALFGFSAPSIASEAEQEQPPKIQWSFKGVTGSYDKAALQRGFQVYSQVCSSCHSLKRVAYRNLSYLGYSEEEIKAIAAEHTIVDGVDEYGEPVERPMKPSDRFASPFPNDEAAKAANNGALPPDLSLIVKARHNGPDHVFAIMTGYEEAPTDAHLMPGQYWNKYMDGHVISMPPPLFKGMVEYEDGTETSVEQYSKDVAHFLAWTASPELEIRKQTGIKILIFLGVFAALMYAVKRSIWSALH